MYFIYNLVGAVLLTLFFSKTLANQPINTSQAANRSEFSQYLKSYYENKIFEYFAAYVIILDTYFYSD